MIRLPLERYYTPTATLGRLCLPDNTYLHTIERPWKNNKVNVSCVPQGLYECHRHNGRKYKNTWEIQVPGRIACVFHAANWAHQLHGCIAPGMKACDVEMRVIDSVEAMELLQDSLPSSFELAIYQYQPAYE